MLLISVGCATAVYRLCQSLSFVNYGTAFFNKLKTVHFGHRVVDEQYFVHLSGSLDGSSNSLLEKMQSSLANHGSVASYFQNFELLTHGKDIH